MVERDRRQSVCSAAVGFGIPPLGHTGIKRALSNVRDRPVTPLEFSAATFFIAAGAGFLGSLTGLGGGVVITPALHLLFHVDLRYAIGATLVSVIATSSGAASAYVTEGLSNIRIGMFLEIATTTGAIFGAFLASRIPTPVLAVIFGVMLLYSAYLTIDP